MRSKIANVLVAMVACNAAFSDTKPTKIIDFNYQGDVLTCDPCPEAITMPAKTVLRNRKSCLPLDAFVQASYIFWATPQDGMNLARSAVLAGGAISLANGSSVLTQPTSYQSGVKAEAGFGFYDWELKLEYTWLDQKTHVNSNAPAGQVWLLNDWFAQGLGSISGPGNPISASNINARWHLGVDLFDAKASSPFYKDKNVIIDPFGGVRLVWIRQNLNIAADVPAGGEGPPLALQPINSFNNSNSWGLGPVLGINLRCLLGSGFRLQGQGNASLLFTQYTTLYHRENAAVTGTIPGYSVRQSNYNCARAMAGLGMGVGWGSYIYSESKRIDFALDYEFIGMWDQNMLRAFVQEYATGVAGYNDLFLHGLTVTGRVDF
jgi:hypothetical protein